MKIKDLSESERPREKMLQSGAAALSNGELIAILLRTGTSKMNAVQTAQTLLSLAGGKLSGLFALDMKSICSVPGIKTDKALTLISAMELGRRFLSEQPVARGKPIVSPRMVFDEMLLEGTLYPHLAEMDNAVHRQIEQTMQTLMQQSTAPNRQTDPMGWTQWMNALQAQAEELAMQQIYSL